MLNAAIAGNFKEHLRLVVVGKDHQIQEDYFDELFALCEIHGIPCCEHTQFVESYFEYKDIFAFAAGWRWLINGSFRQILVFHDSLLPKYRGFNPLVTALLNKDSKIGVTAIIANKEFDCGDIVGSRSTEVIYPIRVENVINILSDLYFDLAKSLFAKIAESGSLRGIPRDDEDYRINWSWPADKIIHFINCHSYPYNGASTMYDGKMIRVLRAVSISDVEIANRDCGKVIFLKDEKPVVICGIGLLLVTVATDNEGLNALPFTKFRVRLK